MGKLWEWWKSKDTNNNTRIHFTVKIENAGYVQVDLSLNEAYDLHKFLNNQILPKG